MNHWHKRFQDENFVYGIEPNVFLSEMQKKLQLSGDALAIAEGEGRNAVYLAQQGMKVTTWDYAQSGLLKTKKLAESKGVSVQTRACRFKRSSLGTRNVGGNCLCFWTFSKGDTEENT